MNVGTHFSNPSFQRVHSRNAGRREEAAFAAKFCSSSFSIPSEGNQSFMTFAKVFDFLDPPPHLSLSHSRKIPCTIICSCSTPSPLKCRCHKWNPPNLSIHCLLSPLPPSLPSLPFPAAYLNFKRPLPVRAAFSLFPQPAFARWTAGAASIFYQLLSLCGPMFLWSRKVRVSGSPKDRTFLSMQGMIYFCSHIEGLVSKQMRVSDLYPQ